MQRRPNHSKNSPTGASRSEKRKRAFRRRVFWQKAGRRFEKFAVPPTSRGKAGVWVALPAAAGLATTATTLPIRAISKNSQTTNGGPYGPSKSHEAVPPKQEPTAMKMALKDGLLASEITALSIGAAATAVILKRAIRNSLGRLRKYFPFGRQPLAKTPAAANPDQTAAANAPVMRVLAPSRSITPRPVQRARTEKAKPNLTDAVAERERLIRSVQKSGLDLDDSKIFADFFHGRGIRIADIGKTVDVFRNARLAAIASGANELQARNYALNISASSGLSQTDQKRADSFGREAAQIMAEIKMSAAMRANHKEGAVALDLSDKASQSLLETVRQNHPLLHTQLNTPGSFVNNRLSVAVDYLMDHNKMPSSKEARNEVTVGIVAMLARMGNMHTTGHFTKQNIVNYATAKPHLRGIWSDAFDYFHRSGVIRGYMDRKDTFQLNYRGDRLADFFYPHSERNNRH